MTEGEKGLLYRLLDNFWEVIRARNRGFYCIPTALLDEKIEYLLQEYENYASKNLRGKITNIDIYLASIELNRIDKPPERQHYAFPVLRSARFENFIKDVHVESEPYLEVVFKKMASIIKDDIVLYEWDCTTKADIVY